MQFNNSASSISDFPSAHNSCGGVETVNFSSIMARALYSTLVDKRAMACCFLELHETSVQWLGVHELREFINGKTNIKMS